MTYKCDFSGCGALGDSVIIATKMLNIISTLPRKTQINYTHFESNVKKHKYEISLNDFWDIIKNKINNLNLLFNYNIKFYDPELPRGTVHRAMLKMSAGLTTTLDALCFNAIPFVVPIKNNKTIIICDGGMGSRCINDQEIDLIFKNFDKSNIILMGINKTKDYDVECDMRGKTTIQHALQIIAGAKNVFSPEGMLVYYAYLQNIPNIMKFSKRSLIKDYWNLELRNNSIATTTIDNININKIKTFK